MKNYKKIFLSSLMLLVAVFTLGFTNTNVKANSIYNVDWSSGWIDQEPSQKLDALFGSSQKIDIISDLTFNHIGIDYGDKSLTWADLNERDAYWNITFSNLIFDWSSGLIDQDPSRKLDALFGSTQKIEISSGLTFDHGGIDYGDESLTWADLNERDAYWEINVYSPIDNKRPAISGQENFATNIDDSKPLSFFMSYFHAYDETDGDLTSSIVVETDNYTPNISNVGTHKVTISVTDLSDNKATLDFYIRVVDVTAPVITGSTTTSSIGYKSTFNIENFRKTLTVSDNYDTLSNEDIVLKTDDYTPNKNKLGTFNLVFEVEDSSGNKGTFTKKVKVIDDVKPAISGPTTITTSNTTILSESDVRAELTANDDIDGNLTSEIKLVEDNYSGNGNKVGSYTIIYEVSDNAGNKATHTVTLKRQDNVPPVIWVEDGVSIKTTSTTPLTHEQIIELLQATGQVSTTSTTNFKFLLDEYTGNEETPGIYAMSIQSKSVDGNESIHNMSMTVLAAEEDSGTDVEPTPTFFQENKLVIIVGVVAIAGLGFMIVSKRK